ncbi:MAG TPA: CoA transferase [Aquabacterium sp.]|nr:CoA transferase [Aquabacterium sp.]
MTFQPLQGLRVLDFGQGVAGPYCAQLLADHGAEVIKVEPARGDWSRTMGEPGEQGQSGVFVSVNRGKRGIALDLRQPEGKAIAAQLAAASDVVVESFRPGVMARLGLGAAELRRTNPGLVYCSVTGFGPDGPNVDLPAGDSTMQAYGGLMSIVGERGGSPLRVGNVVSDMLAGTNAFSGVLLALLRRAADGRGTDVGVSLLDSLVAFQAPPLTEFLMTGKLPQRLGNDHPLIAPSGAVETADGAICFTVFDHQWKGFCEALGLGGLSTDPRFSASGDRQRNRDALKAELAATFASATRAEWLGKLRAIDVLCAPINDYQDVVDDPQVRHNGLVQALKSADGRTYPSIRNPVRMGPAAPQLAPPRLGEHTREILQTLCRLEPEQVDQLASRGAVFGVEQENQHA